MAGDSLARGAKSATFGPPKISQERWDAIWIEDEKPVQGIDHLHVSNNKKMKVPQEIDYGK